MIASQIKVGQDYALSDSPRKGAKDLYAIAATKVRVTDKGVTRWAENAKDEYGDRDGDYKNDGIRVKVLNAHDGSTAYSDVFKARDFLMPWGEYTAEREKRDAEREARKIEREAQQAAHDERMEMSKGALVGLGLVAGQDFFLRYGNEFVLEVAGMEKLSLAISGRIYEAIKNAT